MKDYYKILEVNKSASSEIISKVYKILAKKYHPDMNQENPEEAEEKFKEISEAYEILSNDETRKSYDIELETYEKQLLEENSNPNFVPIEQFFKLQEYCEKLEHSIAQLVSSPNQNNSIMNSNVNYEPTFFQENNDIDDLENLSAEELQSRLDALKYEEKQERKAKIIEFIKNIFALIIIILFILWLAKYNGDISNIK